MTTRQLRKNMHAFLYRITGIDGKDHILKHWCTVRYGTKRIKLVLEADHVRRSIALGGVGNPATCSMAVCTSSHAHLFEHPYLGLINWWASRCYILSSSDKNGLPTQCHIYGHADSIADRNDFATMLDTAAGQKQLLELIEKNGPITIWLEPITPLTEKQKKVNKERRLQNEVELRMAKTTSVDPVTATDKSKARRSSSTVVASASPVLRKKRERKTLGGYGAQRRFVVVQTAMLGIQPPVLAEAKKAV